MKKFLFVVSIIVVLACGAGLSQAQAPPGAILHLDAGDIVDPNIWPDKTGGNDAFPGYGTGDPQFTSVNFPAGNLPVVHFDGDFGYQVTNEDDLNLHEMMVTVVMGDFNSGGGSVICNYQQSPEGGFNIVNDASGKNMYFWTSEPYDRMWSLEPPVIPEYYIMTAIISAVENRKEIFFNGQLSANAHRDNPSGPSTITGYDNAEVAIGSFREFGGYYTGDIAELLVYNDVNDSTRGQVEGYLSTKYGIEVMPPAPSDPSVRLLWLDAALGVTTSGSDVTDWADQSGGGNDVHWSSLFSNGAKAQHIPSAAFPQGTFPVVRFGGNAGYAIDYEDWLDQEELMIFAVCGPFGESEGTGSILANYRIGPEGGFNTAQDGAGSVVSFYTANSIAVEAARMWSNGVATPGYKVVSWIFSNTQQVKRIYLNGAHSLGLADPWVPMDFNGGEIAALGSLREFGNWYNNDLAELIVYGGEINYERRRATELYLYNKYIAAGPLPVTPCGEWGFHPDDLNEDCEVDMVDFSEFALRLMDCTDPDGAGCVDCTADPNDPVCQ